VLQLISCKKTSECSVELPKHIYFGSHIRTFIMYGSLFVVVLAMVVLAVTDWPS